MIRVIGWAMLILLWIPVLVGLSLGGDEGFTWLSSRQWRLLGESALCAALVGALGTLAGFLIGFQACALRDLHQRLLLTALVAFAALPGVVVSTPSLIFLMRVLPNHSQGLLPAVAVQVFAYTPICALLAMLAFSSMPKDQVEASRFLPSQAFAVRKVIVPLLWPGVAASFSVVAILALVDFTIPSIFNWNTYSLEALSDMSAGRPALASCLPLLVIGAAGAILCGRWMSWLVWTESNLKFPKLPVPGSLRVFATTVTWIYLTIAGGMFVGLAADIDSFASAFASLANASGDAVSSLKINLVACAFSLLWGVNVVPLLVWSKTWVPWAAAIAPFSFLPAMVGDSFAQLGVRLGVSGFWLPALALSIRIAPIAAVLAAVFFGQLDRSAIESARLSLPAVRRSVRIYLPLMLPALGMAACLSFISGLGDVGTMLMVVDPGQSTLSLRLYNYLHYGSAPESTVIAFVIMGMAAAFALLFTLRRRTA